MHDVEPTHPTAAALLRDFTRPDGIAKRGADQVAATARERAASYSAAQMIEQFADTGPEAIAKARQLGPVVVDYFGVAMLRLDEVASIGILEATVHMLDLRRTLDLPPDVPIEGLAHTAAVPGGDGTAGRLHRGRDRPQHGGAVPGPDLTIIGRLVVFAN